MKIKKISATIKTPEEVSAILDNNCIEYNSIGCVNWEKDFPYKPEVIFRTAYTDTDILLDYEVSEATARAVAGSDGGNVWEDSCVEFFIRPEDGKEYFNIECNCAGTLLIAKGENRDKRTQLSPAEMAKVKRYSSLGREPFCEKTLSAPWHLSLMIPFSVLGIETVPTGKRFRANFYKCGDALTTPHFLSWALIDAPTPNFHLPEFFAPISFE